MQNKIEGEKKKEKESMLAVGDPSCQIEKKGKQEVRQSFRCMLRGDNDTS